MATAYLTLNRQKEISQEHHLILIEIVKLNLSLEPYTNILTFPFELVLSPSLKEKKYLHKYFNTKLPVYVNNHIYSLKVL